MSSLFLPDFGFLNILGIILFIRNQCNITMHNYEIQNIYIFMSISVT